jgi:hypothetical protein
MKLWLEDDKALQIVSNADLIILKLLQYLPEQEEEE